MEVGEGMARSHSAGGTHPEPEEADAGVEPRREGRWNATGNVGVGVFRRLELGVGVEVKRRRGSF